MIDRNTVKHLSVVWNSRGGEVTVAAGQTGKSPSGLWVSCPGHKPGQLAKSCSLHDTEQGNQKLKVIFFFFFFFFSYQKTDFAFILPGRCCVIQFILFFFFGGNIPKGTKVKGSLTSVFAFMLQRHKLPLHSLLQNCLWVQPCHVRGACRHREEIKKSLIWAGAVKNPRHMQRCYIRYLQHGPGHLHSRSLSHLLGIEMTLKYVKLP